MLSCSTLSLSNVKCLSASGVWRFCILLGKFSKGWVGDRIFMLFMHCLFLIIKFTIIMQYDVCAVTKLVTLKLVKYPV